MPWWGWLCAGIGLLGVEMFLIDAQFYLVFIGSAAAVVGLLGLAGIQIPDWAQWLLFSALSIVSMLTFRKRIYKLVRGRTGHIEERLTLGDRVTVPVSLIPGATCRIEYRGSSWNARNVGETVIDGGREANIVKIDGLTLNVSASSTIELKV